MAESFAELVKEQRQKRGLTQEEAAELVGVTPKTLREWEKGRRRPRTFMARCVAQAFGLSQRSVLQLVSCGQTPSSARDESPTGEGTCGHDE